MATPSTSKELSKNPEEEPTTSDNKIMALAAKTTCFLCQRTFFFKRILRLIIREFSFYITIQLIQMDILDGVVTVNSRNNINYLKLSDEYSGFYPTHEDIEQVPSPGRYFERISDFYIVRRLEREPCWSNSSRRTSAEREEADEGNDGIVESFISRLANNLGIDVSTLEDTIDHVMTSRSEVLLEMDYRKLKRVSSQNDAEIKSIIDNMFWQPKASQQDNNPVGIETSSNRSSHSSSNFSSRIRSRSVPQDRSKDNGWFKAVDRGRVVPFHSKRNASIFKSPNTVRDLLDRCIHEIEKNMINAFSWYVDEYFYHDFVFPRITTLTYAQYKDYQKVRKIRNPKVVVGNYNPLDLDTHFAYVLSFNFYSHHKYVQRYMRDIGLFCESVIRVNKDVPFVIRSLNPVTRMHIFHMVYKRYNYSRPSYEHVFKTLIMLRDAMFRLRLKDISMCKIGCCCERLNFGKILRMTEYVFMDTDINVRIGLNLMKCWRLRSHSLKNQGKISVPADLYADRVDHFSTRDESANDSEVRSTDEE